MSFDVMLRQMTAGFGQTCLIFFMTLIFSLPLGMLVYFGRVSRIKPISWIVKIYISIMRRNPVDAAASGVVFRTVLSVADEYRRV